MLVPRCCHARSVTANEFFKPPPGPSACCPPYCPGVAPVLFHRNHISTFCNYVFIARVPFQRLLLRWPSPIAIIRHYSLAIGRGADLMCLRECNEQTCGGLQSSHRRIETPAFCWHQVHWHMPDAAEYFEQHLVIHEEAMTFKYTGDDRLKLKRIE